MFKISGSNGLSGGLEPPDQLGQLAAGSLEGLLGGREAVAGGVDPAQRLVDLLLQDIVTGTVAEVVDRSQEAIITSIVDNDDAPAVLVEELSLLDPNRLGRGDDHEVVTPFQLFKASPMQEIVDDELVGTEVSLVADHLKA